MQEYKDDSGIPWGKVPGFEGLVEPNQTLNWSRARNTITNSLFRSLGGQRRRPGANYRKKNSDMSSYFLQCTDFCY